MTTGLSTDSWSEVRRLPSSFAPFAAEELTQRAAGSHGKTAFMHLRFEALNGRTRLVDSFGSGVQVVHRVHYIDTELEDLAVVFIQSVGAGILQGDRVRSEIVVGDGARVLVTTQAATKLHRMEANYATQRLDVTVGPRAYAEILMDPLIPCRGARLYTELNFTVDPSSVLVYQDHTTAGRVAHGESFEYDLLYTRMRCSGPDGRLVVADTAVMEPGRTTPQRPAMLGGATDVGTMYVIAHGSDASALAAAVHERVEQLEDVDGSASAMPSQTGVYVRLLSARTAVMQRALHHCWETTRSSLLGVGVPNVFATKYGFAP